MILQIELLLWIELLLRTRPLLRIVLRIIYRLGYCYGSILLIELVQIGLLWILLWIILWMQLEQLYSHSCKFVYNGIATALINLGGLVLLGSILF